MGPTTSDENPTADVAEAKVSANPDMRAKPLGRIRTGLLFFCGMTILIALHALALVVLDWTTVLYGIVFGGTLLGIWLWTDGARRLIAITVAAIVSVAAREMLLPSLYGPQQIAGLVIGVALGVLDLREIEFWRRLRASQRAVTWPRWRVFRPNVYLRVAVAVLVLAATAFVGRQYWQRNQRERLIAEIEAGGGQAFIENRSPSFSRLSRRDTQWILRQFGVTWWFDHVGSAYLGPQSRRGIFSDPKWIVGPNPTNWIAHWAPQDSRTSRELKLQTLIPTLVGQGTQAWELSSQEIVNDDLAPFQTIETSYYIGINCPQVTDDGLTFLSRIDGLQYLDLGGTAVSGDVLLAIPAGSGITHLCIDFTQIDNRALDSLQNMPSLSVLWLRGTRVTDDGVAKLAPCIWLTTLDLSDTAITNQGVRQLAPLVNLRWLGLDGCDISADGLAALASHPVLTKLSLVGTPIDDDDLAALKGMPSLEEIDLEDTQVGDGAWQVLSTIPTLRVVDMSGTNVTDAGIETLLNPPNFVVGVAVPDMPAGPLPPNLVRDRQLALRGTAITDRSLEVLGKLKHLRWLDLAETDVTDSGLRHLEQLSDLRHLDVRGTAVTPPGIERLKETSPDLEVKSDDSPE